MSECRSSRAVSSSDRFPPQAREAQKEYLRVNGLPDGESPTEQQHAAEQVEVVMAGDTH
jgi:hypothetical protein